VLSKPGEMSCDGDIDGVRFGGEGIAIAFAEREKPGPCPVRALATSKVLAYCHVIPKNVVLPIPLLNTNS
jgi:hypothetical protein